MKAKMLISKVLCNPFIWLYFISILFIFIISLNTVTHSNLFVYIGLSITGFLTIIGICTSPVCKTAQSAVDRNKNKSEGKVD
ncbi:MAG: hypothetical protein N2749_01555 [Clostridia bacterium]|nr:hypothetical protein [Clostridia bacterium]